MTLLKNSLLLALILCCVFSCNKESGSISGSWVKSIDDQPQHKNGFTLKNDGSVDPINLGDRAYQKWQKFGDRLILSGKNSETRNNGNFSDTLKIISVGDSLLVLKSVEGLELTYTKTLTPEKLVSVFQTYHCYQFTAKKDTAFLHINIANDIVTGELSYNLFEKDRNTGSVKGKMIGDTLIADYTFMSEGRSSVREVIMLKKENNFIEGLGDITENNNKVTYTNRSKISFKNGLNFKMINCP